MAGLKPRPSGSAASSEPVQARARDAAHNDKDLFWAFAKAGKELAGLHIEYESLEPYPLKFMETGASVAAVYRPPALTKAKTGAPFLRQGRLRAPLQNADLKVGATVPLCYRVEDKMRLAKDHHSLKVNDSLTLGGIPPETFEYRLGNRSALEWVIDQYQVTEDKHSGIRSDPNRPDDPEYIVRLVGQVIRVSLETVKLVKSLPAL
jgi:predicted helicase